MSGADVREIIERLDYVCARLREHDDRFVSYQERTKREHLNLTKTIIGAIYRKQETIDDTRLPLQRGKRQQILAALKYRLKRPHATDNAVAAAGLKFPCVDGYANRTGIRKFFNNHPHYIENALDVLARTGLVPELEK